MQLTATVLYRGLALLGMLSSLSCAPSDPAALPDVVDYNFHVKPILADNCFLCHGHDPESRKADLELHTPEGLLGALKDDTSRFVIVPHQPAESEFIRRISSSRAQDRMPPPEASRPLSSHDRAMLQRWVEQGAQWKPHWAFLPPVKPSLPEVRNRRWPHNTLDYFVLARLEALGQYPSDLADRRTLIRRLYLDLTGLPPTAEEVRAFVSDRRPDAYEALVDRLLGSPHYGERMALQWLDLARYADTNGYSIDGGRTIWIWRDWVIAAFNANMPYDTFVMEQLAGDLLPEPTETQRIATGFMRNNMVTHEGGTIPEENLTNYVADRVKTFGEVFLGLTLACAQCHDHKYDPITQREYYRLFAFFNRTDERGLDGNSGINPVPSLPVKSPLINEAEIAELQASLDRVNEALAKDHPQLQDAWEKEQRGILLNRGKDLALYPLTATDITTPNSGYTGEVLEDGSVWIEQGGGLAAYNVTLELDTPAQPVTGLRIVFYRGADGTLGHGPDGDFILTSAYMSAGMLPSAQVDYHMALPFRHATASTWDGEAYPPQDVLDERRDYGWSPGKDSNVSPHITLTLEGPLDPTRAPHLTVMLNFGHGQNMIPRHFRIYAFTGNDDGSNLDPLLQESLLTSSVDRTDEHLERLRTGFFSIAEATRHLRYENENLGDRKDQLTLLQPTMVMMRATTPRPTHILHRGQYDQPLDRVFPGAPSFLPPLPDDTSLTRLDLAKWLFEPGHPLTARVAVNRFWHLLFDRGLVATPADFGARGALPSHPALLDYLATTFADSGYDVKALLKLIVMSATYQQSSSTTPETLAADPENVLLGRGARFRLQAEFIRDGALKVSGLMVPRIGGQSVHPYQPPNLWKEVSHYGSTPATAQTFAQDHGEKLYRRSLYTFWKRTAPPPSMMAFDAPTREVCTVTREQTNTPLQALILLNDVQFVEASRALAERILRVAPKDRIRFAFEEVTGREADRRTQRILQQRLDEEFATFRADPQRAVEYLSVGESLRDDALDPVEHAAWTVVASLLLNLSETVTRS